jgi:hypothetical protein
VTLKASIRGYYDRLLIRRRKNLFHKTVLTGMDLIRPRWAAYRRESLHEWVSRCRVSIRSPSDSELNLYRQLQWGDTWAKYELTKALGESGYLVTDVDPDVVIDLLGKPAEVCSRAYNIAWIYSHPEWITPQILKRYDRIFCLSLRMTQDLNAMGFEAEWAPGATARAPWPGSNPILYDIVFVGNTRSRHGGHRQILVDLGITAHNLKVWGSGWDKVLPQRYIGGEYFDYTRLDRLYSSAMISLNDHSHEMRQAGFVALRVFDILASGGFCISDANPGLEPIFGDAVPQYHSAEELRHLVDFYIQNPKHRLRLMKKGQGIALSHTWSERVGQFVRGMDERFQQTEESHSA